VFLAISSHRLCGLFACRSPACCSLYIKLHPIALLRDSYSRRSSPQSALNPWYRFSPAASSSISGEGPCPSGSGTELKRRRVPEVDMSTTNDPTTPSKAKSRTVMCHEISEWQWDNKYILSGYRPEKADYWEIFVSLIFVRKRDLQCVRSRTPIWSGLCSFHSSQLPPCGSLASLSFSTRLPLKSTFLGIHC
jgi:hypothetical protein